MTTHKQHLLAWFRRGKSITSIEAINQWGDTRLADTVHRLREAGHDIVTEMLERENGNGNKTRFARYHYIAGPKGETPDSAGALSAPPHNEIVSIADRLRGMWGKVRGG